MARRTLIGLLTLIAAAGLVAVALGDCAQPTRSPNNPPLLNGEWGSTNWAAPCANTTGSTCAARCNAGYTSLPNPTMTCVGTTWVNNTPAVCEPVCTGAPPALAGTGSTWGSAGNSNCSNSIAQGRVCTGTCGTGYVGSPTILCNKNSRTWSVTNQVGKCVTPAAGACLNPLPTPANTVPFPTTCEDAVANSVCPSTCSKNFGTATGPNVAAVCTGGSWQIPSPCVRVCPDPPAIPNVLWGNAGNNNCKGSIPLLGVCTGTCTGGTSGGVTLTCNNDSRTWDAPDGACGAAGGCFGEPSLVDAEFPTCAGKAAGSTCVGKCRDSFRYVNVTLGIDETFVWGNSKKTGPVVTATCTAGNWVTTDECVRVCPTAPPVTAGVTWNGGANLCNSSIPFSEKCMGSCTAPNTGKPNITCQDGNWIDLEGGCSNAATTCQGQLPQLENGEWDTNCFGKANGQTCAGTCRETFVSNTSVIFAFANTKGTGSAVTATCTNGKWVTTDECVRVCPTPPPALTSGGTWTSAVRGCNSSVAFGSTCNGTCPGGQKPYVECNDNAWGPVMNPCGLATSCTSLPPAVANGAFPTSCVGTANGGTCTATCTNKNPPTGVYYIPFPLGSSVTATCVSGSWQLGTSTCVRACRPTAAPVLPGGTSSWNCALGLPTGKVNGQPLQTCTGTCRNTAQWGAPTIQCDANVWTNQVGTCHSTRVCVGLPAVATKNGDWPDSCADTPVNGFCTISCNKGTPGYAGNATVQCVQNNANTVSGANWATQLTPGTVMCARINTRRLLA